LILIGVALGLAVFLIGIKLMSKTFEGIVSVKLKNKIEKLTTKKINGVIIGATITGLLQSSSATTIIAISMVHSNLLSLNNAVPIIMGANIGTTITAQLVAFKIESLELYLLALGLILYPILRKKQYGIIPKMLLCFSLIYGGIDIISYAISPIKSSPDFYKIITSLSNNGILGILVGFITTAVIQSSSTGVALLQIIASGKIISVKTAIYIMLGQNIGTCVNTLVASIATNRIGKQAAIIHVLFNVLGVFIFYFFIDEFYKLVYMISPSNVLRQIANAHTLFNTITTAILLPFSSFLVVWAKKIIKE